MTSPRARTASERVADSEGCVEHYVVIRVPQVFEQVMNVLIVIAAW
jgi:hypothetical protein